MLAEDRMQKKFLINAIIYKPVAHGLVSPPASQKQEGCSLNILRALLALFSFPSSAMLMRKQRWWEEEEKIEGGKTAVKVSLPLDLHQMIESPTLGESLRPVLFVNSAFKYRLTLWNHYWSVLSCWKSCVSACSPVISMWISRSGASLYSAASWAVANLWTLF